MSALSAVIKQNFCASPKEQILDLSRMRLSDKVDYLFSALQLMKNTSFHMHVGLDKHTQVCVWECRKVSRLTKNSIAISGVYSHFNHAYLISFSASKNKSIGDYVFHLDGSKVFLSEINHVILQCEESRRKYINEGLESYFPRDIVLLIGNYGVPDKLQLVLRGIL
ncbi:MAG TPA: hypothetical protein VGJ00_05940 [Rhabdochlamydiaceae bacterium]|jgi:hypothetical protein